MRSLDLYSEKLMRDGSPDKIAASQAFLHEANGICLSGNAPENQFASRGSAASGGSTRSGLLSVFTDNAINNKGQDARDKMTLASVAMFNPLMLMGMGATMVIIDEMKMARERQLLTRDNSNEELYKAGTVRELRRAKERESKADAVFKPRLDALTLSIQVPDDLATKKKSKLPFLKDKVSISSSQAMNDAGLESKRSRDWTKANRLLKQKRELKDHLEKFRGKLDLQTVSNLVSQIEQLDKALIRLGY
jgi:hypothetical protein